MGCCGSKVAAQAAAADRIVELKPGTATSLKKELCFAIIGVDNAGKTTIANVLAGFAGTLQGEITRVMCCLLALLRLKKASKRRRCLSWIRVFQNQTQGMEH